MAGGCAGGGLSAPGAAALEDERPASGGSLSFFTALALLRFMPFFAAKLLPSDVSGSKNPSSSGRRKRPYTTVFLRMERDGV